MKLKVLVDNNTFIDHYHYGEPALSFYIEDDGKKILFDVGYSDLFMENAYALEIDLNRLTDIVISHGHDDHSAGLAYFFKRFKIPNLKITAHPNAFKEKIVDGKPYGSPMRNEEIEQYAKLRLSREPLKISKNIYFLGEIPSSNDFEARQQFGQTNLDGSFVDDFVTDDSAIVYEGDGGLFIMTGCSHSGICNIIEHSKTVCNNDKIAGIIGGFHLFDIDYRLEETLKYFVKNNVKNLCPCHCVSLKVKAEIYKYIPIQEVGVGFSLDL